MTKNPFDHKLTREEFHAWMDEQERLACARIRMQSHRTYEEIRREENRATGKAIADILCETPVVREVTSAIVSVFSLF